MSTLKILVIPYTQMDLCYETAHSLANKLLTCWPSFKASSTRPSIFFFIANLVMVERLQKPSQTNVQLHSIWILWGTSFFFFEQLAVTEGLPTGL